jgi:hypothetical protein
VTAYKTTWRHWPKDRDQRFLHCENFKSQLCTVPAKFPSFYTFVLHCSFKLMVNISVRKLGGWHVHSRVVKVADVLNEL